jgi:polyribonucleotide nucleotidyltransferase
MGQKTVKTLMWGGRELRLETGEIARQADGAVLASYGETSVLCTVVCQKKPSPGTDFFPLSVHYQERYAAVGRIPGGYIKREGKPSEKEVLTSRLIDRPIRPLFPDHFYNETQVICTLLSHDSENDADIVSIIGASAALALSGVPFLHVVGAARVGYQEGSFILNPTFEQLTQSQLDLVVAGTKEGVLMVESEAQELPESTMLDAVMFAHDAFQPVIALIDEMVAQAGKPRWELPQLSTLETDTFKAVKKHVEKGLKAAYKLTEKQARYAAIDAVKEDLLAKMLTDDKSAAGVTQDMLIKHLETAKYEVVRQDLLKTKKRIDGRGTTDIRPISTKVGFLPRVHGSALFTRGETQALVITTLGTKQDEQIVDALEGEYRERFMLHYNFPPYSVGEVGRMSGPGRREIGHGKLAWRSLRPMLPAAGDFPYTIRSISEITESNGSSSMATVCGTCMAMMDAGVPLKKPVAGIAMGLVKEEKDYVVLSDILGDEDHLGDMDFKVAGTAEGVTALQMDIKITSITKEIMTIALDQARAGRLHILGEMEKTLPRARTAVSKNAPRMHTIQINREKIRDLIGPGGKVIREICEYSGTRIDISEEGVVEVSGPSQEAIDKAEERIKGVVGDLEIGSIYKGRVTRLLEFGAIVTFMGEKSGMVHISQLSPERVKTVGDVVKEGDEVFVKVMEVEDRGKVKLSMKAVDQTTGQDLGAGA